MEEFESRVEELGVEEFVLLGHRSTVQVGPMSLPTDVSAPKDLGHEKLMTYRKEQLTGAILGIEASITSSAASEEKVLDYLMRMEARFNAKQDETLDELNK